MKPSRGKDHVGTAAPGCPAEQGSAALTGKAALTEVPNLKRSISEHRVSKHPRGNLPARYDDQRQNDMARCVARRVPPEKICESNFVLRSQEWPGPLSGCAPQRHALP